LQPGNIEVMDEQLKRDRDSIASTNNLYSTPLRNNDAFVCRDLSTPRTPRRTSQVVLTHLTLTSGV